MTDTTVLTYHADEMESAWRFLSRFHDVTAFSDGACSPNPGPGGFGVVIRAGAATVELFGGQLRTTNNRMEMTAALLAVDLMPVGARVVVRADSQYVQRGIERWIPNWRTNGWTTLAGEEVKNRDLWEQLARACDLRRVEWKWVRGHSGNKHNERADSLARLGMRAELDRAKYGNDGIFSDGPTA